MPVDLRRHERGIDRQRPIEIRDGFIPLLEFHVRNPAVVVRFDIFGIDRKRAVVFLDRIFKLPESLIEQTAIEIA